MSARTIARKEFADAVRSRMLWALTAVFVALTAGGTVAFDAAFDGFTVAAATQSVAVPAAKLVPLTALVVGYLAIAGERESGSVRVLLGLPVTRRDVVLGKLLGRTGVVAVAVVTALLAGGVAVLAAHGAVRVVDLGIVTAVTVVFALTYVGIAVGVSAFASTRSRAMAGAIGVFAVFGLLWNLVPASVYYLLHGTTPSTPVPAWYLLVQRLNPENAYAAAQRFLLSDLGSSYVVSPSGPRQGPAPELSRVVAGEVPFYAEYWFGLVILAAWTVVPVAVGYLRFRRVDIG